MAKISVDKNLCTGCGLCAANCPEVFELNEDNIANVKAQSCDSCNLKQIASECPGEAIKVEE
jgi:ferredoxin